MHKRRYIVVCATEVDENDNRVKRVKKMPLKTKIIHLNDDCLEKLFFYLRLKDLGNIAMTNTRFTNRSQYVFNKLHANTLIVFDPCTSNGRVFNSFLNILNGFGDYIRKLNVTFYQEKRYKNRNEQILRCIIEKCSKSVTELTISNVNDDMFISKEFLHLQKLRITDSYFNDSMAQLIRNSPNISCLEFYSVSNVFNASFVEQRVPLMKHFTNYNQVIMDSEVENLQKFRRFVNVNNQLTSLCVGDQELEMMFRYEEIRRQFFKTIHRKLPCPDRSNLITYLMPFEPLYFGNMKHLCLSLGYSTDFLQCLRRRRLVFKHLPVQHLEFYVGHLHIESVDMILQFRHLQKLQLYVCEHLNITNFMLVALNSPRLTELELYCLYDEHPEFSTIPVALKEIINHAEWLRRIVVGFEIKKPSHSTNLEYKRETVDTYQSILCDEFNEELPNGWRVHFETNNIDIKRQNVPTSFFLCSILELQTPNE